MYSKTTRIFNFNGEKYKFDHDCFEKKINEYAKKSSLTVLSIKDQLADEVDVSIKYIDYWINGNTSPKTVETIIQLANYLKIEPESLLLKLEYKHKTFDNRQLDALKRIYDSVKRVFWIIETTHGFADTIAENIGKLNGNPFDLTFEYVHKLYNETSLVISQEEFDLVDTETYSLIYYEWNDFLEKYDELMVNALPQNVSRKYTKQEVDHFLQTLRDAETLAEECAKAFAKIYYLCV